MRDRERERQRQVERDRQTETKTGRETIDVLLSSANKLTRQGETNYDQLSITHNDMYKSSGYHRVT